MFTRVLSNHGVQGKPWSCSAAGGDSNKPGRLKLNKRLSYEPVSQPDYSHQTQRHIHAENLCIYLH